jgi:hypothetical protein
MIRNIEGGGLEIVRVPGIQIPARIAELAASCCGGMSIQL